MSDDIDSNAANDAAIPDAPLSPSATPVSRRAALKVLGAVPVAGALIGSAAFAQQGTPTQQSPQLPKQTHETASPPPKGTGKGAFFTAAELRTVSVLADDIIPRDARSGSATDAGVPAFIDYQLSVRETGEDDRVAMRGGLAWLNTESRKRFQKNYASLTADQRNLILDDISWPGKTKPEFSQGTAFFSDFRDLVGMGFFSSAMGWKDLRYEGNVFNPNWQGCPEAAMKKLGVSHALMDTRIKPDQPTG